MPKSSPEPFTGARPKIALPLAREWATWGPWDLPADLLNSAYSAQVREAGGIPLMVPVGGSAEEAREVIALADGLLLAGGADVHPERYGRPPGRSRARSGWSGTVGSSRCCPPRWSAEYRFSVCAAVFSS